LIILIYSFQKVLLYLLFLARTRASVISKEDASLMEKSLSELLMDWVVLVESVTIDLFIDRALSFSSPHPLLVDDPPRGARPSKGEGGKLRGSLGACRKTSSPQTPHKLFKEVDELLLSSFLKTLEKVWKNLVSTRLFPRPTNSPPCPLGRGGWGVRVLELRVRVFSARVLSWTFEVWSLAKLCSNPYKLPNRDFFFTTRRCSLEMTIFSFFVIHSFWETLKGVWGINLCFHKFSPYFFSFFSPSWEGRISFCY